MSNFITYKASAGSGKTYTLAVEYIKQLLLSEEQHAHRHILAVTFTKDATGEMKDRIVAELFGLAFGLDEANGFLHSLSNTLQEAGVTMTEKDLRNKARRILQEILHDYSRFYVGTIDSFFQRVLRNLARELGKGSKFNIELNTDVIVEEAVKAMIEKAHEDKELLEWMSRYVSEKIEQGKSWNVKQELKSFGMNIFNESFQEHEAALRRQLDENPKLFDELHQTHRRLSKEFETKMQAFSRLFFKHLSDNDVSPYDLAGARLTTVGYVASYYNKILSGTFGDDICGATIEQRLVDAGKWSGGKVNPSQAKAIEALATATLMPLLNETETFRREHLELYNSSQLVLKNIHQLGLLDKIAKEIELQNKEKNRFMLSQTALFLSEMIADSDASFVYEKIGSEIKHVMIDEFQDTSRLQWKNFYSLLKEIKASGNFSLLVGDVKQSIYRWRNGDWSILNSIEKYLTVETKQLETNYRSQKRIVEFNNAFFTSAATDLDARFKNEFETTEQTPFETAYSLANVEQKAPMKEERGYVEISLLSEGKNAEIKYDELLLQAILEKIERLQVAGVRPKQICVLARTNEQIRAIASFLASQKEANPQLAEGKYLDVVSNEAFQLNSSPVIQILIEALRTLADWENRVPRAQLLLLWKGATETTLDIHSLLCDEAATDALLPVGFRKADFETLAVIPLYELILHIYQLFGLQRIENQSGYLYAFLDNLTRYLQQNPSDIQAFLDYWDEDMCRQSVPNESGLEAVRAMTIHKSKGLQFHSLIVAYCDWEMAKSSSPRQQNLVWCKRREAPFQLEILPIDYNRQMQKSIFAPEFKAETCQLWMDNLNILYVAFTRAERNLFILSKKRENKKGKEPGKFLVSDIIGKWVERLSENFDDENNRWEKGEIDAATEVKQESRNIFKSGADSSQKVAFTLEQPFFDKSASNRFLQSNKSRDFIAGREALEDKNYIKQGNIMHALFSNIRRWEDIETAVKKLIFEGLITHNEEKEYINRVQEAIQKSQVEDWFSEAYTLFNECDILFPVNGKVHTRRPDRVMVGKDEVIVVDYKFGEEKTEHTCQVSQYIELLNKMGYARVKGYIWYVAENRIHKV